MAGTRQRSSQGEAAEMSHEPCVVSEGMNLLVPMGCDELKKVEELMARAVAGVKRAAEAKDWFVGMRDELRNVKIIQGLKYKLSKRARSELIVVLYDVATTTPDLDETLLKTIGQACTSAHSPHAPTAPPSQPTTR